MAALLAVLRPHRFVPAERTVRSGLRLTMSDRSLCTTSALMVVGAVHGQVRDVAGVADQSIPKNKKGEP